MKTYSIGDQTYKVDEENIIILKVGYTKAMQALYKLHLYEEQNANGDIELITRINQHKRVMRARKFKA